MTNREQLLLKMYDQLFNDINRHIMVVWQSIGVLVGAFAIFALVENKVMPLDIAASIVLLLSAWLIAHLFDSAYWYNRNLVMIANIERQFLKKKDLTEVHYYFGAHRPNNKMIEHLKLQLALGIGLGLIVLFYHFFQVIMPALRNEAVSLKALNYAPYSVVVISWGYLVDLKTKLIMKYNEFLRNSPGKEVETANIEYGVGHGHQG